MLQDHPLEILQHLRDSQRAVTLTVDGKPSAVIQHPAAYQRLLDLAAFASAEEGIRQGREDAAAGRVTDIETTFKQMRAEFGIPE
jgi:PHD/YefM family antitoxin component YafN of YafNO toxin-antitoxin module